MRGLPLFLLLMACGSENEFTPEDDTDTGLDSDTDTDPAACSTAQNLEIVLLWLTASVHSKDPRELRNSERALRRQLVLLLETFD